MPSNFNLALVQQAAEGTPEEIFARTLAGIRHAKNQHAQLVLLQELHKTPYFCQTKDDAYFKLAETIPGPTTQALSQLAEELKIVIVCSLFEKTKDGQYHNTAVVLEKDGSIAGTYRKKHIPDDPGYHETHYFTSGAEDFKPIKTSLGNIGLLICWDQWFPEAARIMALKGADILLYPTAIGWDKEDPEAFHHLECDAWVTVQRGHAVANCIPLAACNRIGTETQATKTTTYWGNSFIAGMQGEILAQASQDKAEVLLATIDFSQKDFIAQRYPLLRHRLPEAYGDLAKITGEF